MKDGPDTKKSKNQCAQRVQRFKEDQLTEAEEKALRPFLKVADEDDEDEDMTPIPLDFEDEPKYESFEDLMKKADNLKKEAKEQGSKYEAGIHAVMGTAATVEQVWSQADEVLTKRRSGMSPLLFECILYLKFNRDLWGMDDIAEANRRRMNESTQKWKDKVGDRQVNMSAAVNAWEKEIEAFECARAASLCFSAIKIVSSLKNETFVPDSFRGKPLCMDQFRALFGACRVPELEEKDTVAVNTDSTH
eukprot:scaffold166891_cov21-Cyclotella_meneghiniana.AAC.1